MHVKLYLFRKNNLLIIKKAEITVVKPQVSNFKKFHLLDIGIQGKSKQKLSSLRCTFSSLKFLTTSYNHNVILKKNSFFVNKNNFFIGFLYNLGS